MAMLSRSIKQKQIINQILVTFGLAVGILLTLLIIQAVHLSKITTPVKAIVHIGPLQLIELHKSPEAGGGFSGSIKLLPGLAVYCTIVALISFGLVAAKLGSKQKAGPIPD